MLESEKLIKIIKYISYQQKSGKIKEIDLRTPKIKKIIEIYVEDNENHENLRNPYENLTKKLKIQR